MITFKPDTDQGYRELETAIQPQTYRVEGYRPEDVIELLARLWAYPYTPYDCYRLMKGDPAEIIVQRTTETIDFEPTNRPVDTIRYLHGCDIVFYRPCPSLIDMLHYDRCFVSLDCLSAAEAQACVRGEKEQGLFVVYQLYARPFPQWSEELWKSFGCEARPHVLFQFP